MKFSEERIRKLALQIHDKLYFDNLVDYIEEDEALKVIKEVMTKFFQLEDQIHDIVSQKIMSLKKGILPGMTEWDVLYQKYFEQEMAKYSL